MRIFISCQFVNKDLLNCTASSKSGDRTRSRLFGHEGSSGMELSSLLTESPSYSTIERYYTPSGDEICGETLIFSQVLQKCVVKCIYPLYKEDEITILYAIAAVFGYIGFLGNFFVCFTGLFRPSMRRYPNSNAYFLCFFSALSCFAGIWENLLGLRYVFCDDNVNSGSVNNWACVVDCLFFSIDLSHVLFRLFQFI